MSVKTLFCDGWEFALTPIDTEYSDGLEWKRVDIPHDFLIYDVNDLYKTSTGWYRKKFLYKKTDKRASVRFDGIYMDSRVYVNGTLAGEWKYGYTTFEFDITELLRDGENLISVRVDHREPNSRWYSGAGIYRSVWFKEYGSCHITNDGVYISADVDGTVKITVEAERPEQMTAASLRVRNSVFYNGDLVGTVENACCAFDKSRIAKYILKDGCKYSVNTDEIKIDSPVLWDITSPKLYTCVTELLKDGSVIDREETVFGFREIKFTCDKGFFLNGRHLKIHGCCEHHDLGCLGAAVNINAIRRKLKTLRTMGINAIRTSHNPPAPEFMQLADEMGFLILSEGFDMWELSKTENDYARFFDEWIEKDVASWIRRDRNHPSVIGWSIGNEIYDTHVSERGQEITSMLMGLVREHDPRANGYVTIGSNSMQCDNGQRCADILKLAGYNYAERLYEEHHRSHPDWMIYGSETSSVVQSRGIYHFPLAHPSLSEDDEQCSALGGVAPAWAAKSAEACIIPDRDAEYCAGQFIWTGFDYIGEPTPYATKNSYFGQFDTAGFAKDSAYIFRSAWTDCGSAPFVHIFPYWDFSGGQPIDIRVASNAPRVELYFNGELAAAGNFDRSCCQELLLDTQIKYRSGELTAIARDKNGNEIARDTVRSFSNAAKLELCPDVTEINANGTDLIFVEINALDENGEFAANANNRVFVSVTGAGRLIGLDNGDSTDYDQYKGTSRRLFSGKLLAVIAAKKTSGEIKLRVTSKGLPDCEALFTAKDCEPANGVSAVEENTFMPAECADAENDIPVRKIEFIGEERVFTPEKREITFKTKVYPENASYANEIDYRITAVIGADSNDAEIVNINGNEVTVRCNGDGEFWLRALCKNGTKKYHILSAIPLVGEGLGSATLDPYEFMPAGLFTASSGNISNGLYHGAAFASVSSYFAFESVDFGRTGSDEIYLPIYTLNSTPIKFRIYDGIPGEGGELIGDYTYHHTSVWQTYNEPEKFKLTKTLKGIHTIAFESSDAFEIKGFVFEKNSKEFSRINAAENDTVYGDKFTCGEDEVTGIGNNVILDFGEFDFTSCAPSAIVITGRSQLPVNSIHIIFKGETEKRMLAEFERAESYTERRFDVSGISGKCSVSFAFLPGSDFDFKDFRFEK